MSLLRTKTPVEDHSALGCWVKREDLACAPPGPAFSKIRGVLAHLKTRPEGFIGVLDTYHSQAGQAVAYVCKHLGKRCVNFYPEFKKEPGPRNGQLLARGLGAELVPIRAGRSAILFFAARKVLDTRFGARGYMMPNALKLRESVVETAREVNAEMARFKAVVIPVSSGTIAAGVIRGFLNLGLRPRFYLHLGYSRSAEQVERYLGDMVGPNYEEANVQIVDEGWTYREAAEQDGAPPWPCNQFYDLKAYHWLRQAKLGADTLFWNIG